MQRKVKIVGLVVVMGALWLITEALCSPLQAQQIDFYPADPWVSGTVQGNGVQTLGAPHPNPLPSPPAGFGGLFTVPQSVVVRQGILDDDSRADAIAVPGHFAPEGQKLFGNCYGDLKNSVNLLAVALVPPCIDGKCGSKCTKVPIGQLPENVKAICDKGCNKFFPWDCLANCQANFLALKNTELGKCVEEIKKNYPNKFDACFTSCVAKPGDFDQCKQASGCANKPTAGEQKQCENNCYEEQLGKTKGCDQKCLFDGEQDCFSNCMVTSLDCCQKNLPNCEKCDDDYLVCVNDCLKPGGTFSLCVNQAESAAFTKEKECEETQKCFDKPIADYKTDCSSITISPPDCLTILSKDDVQQCLLTPKEGMKTLESGDVPESCKGEVQSAFLVNDGDQDISDTLLTDNWGPDPAFPLISMDIPDPIDSAFATVSRKNQLFLPIDVAVGSFDPADAAPEAVVLNAFPLDKGALSQLVSKMKSDKKEEQLAFIQQITPQPLPAFLSDPQYQSKAPLFFLRNGVTNPEYNLENECNTNKDKSPRNCLSTPVAVQPVSVSGSGGEDLAILHQFFSTPTEDINPAQAMFGGWEKDPIGVLLKPLLMNILSPSLLGKKSAVDYCSNLTDDGVLPGQLPGNDSSQAINVGYLGIGFNALGGTYSGLKIETPVTNEIVGYLTLHTNDGQGHFSKWPKPDEPYRLCVGKTPVGLAKLNVDGPGFSADDSATANFGGIAAQDPLKPEISSMTFEVSGGVTFIHNYQGGMNGKEEILNLPLRTGGSTHPIHLSSIACGDINADGYDDCITTAMDAVGMHVNLVAQTAYQVPDVIATSQKGFAPDFSGKCNDKDFPPPEGPITCPDANGVASYGDLAGFGNNKWSCTKVTTNKNPANENEPGSSPSYDLYQCGGKSNDPTCGFPFNKKYANSYVYKVNYKINYPIPIVVLPGKMIKTKGFPPADWNCTEEAATPESTSAGIFSWQCALPANINVGAALGSWKCHYTDKPQILNKPEKNLDPIVVDKFQEGGLTYTETDVNSGIFQAPADGLPDKNLFSCEGMTTAGGSNPPSLPLPLQSVKIPFYWEATQIGDIAATSPVERDAVYLCNSTVPIERNSEFAVYVNKGAGFPFAQQFTNDPEYHQYVNMAAYNVPRIVPDFPLDTVTETGPTSLNKDKMSVVTKTFAKGSKPGNFIGLGVWPFHAALADLVDKMGAPHPDGCADAVIALNNSFYVALIPSQACKPAPGQPGKYERDKMIQQPFTGAPTLFFDSATPHFKHAMAEFVNGPLQKLVDNQPLDAADKLTLGIALMSGTSYVTVPFEPLTGEREFTDLPPARGIVAIHGFPWRLLIATANSMELPTSLVEGLMKSFESTLKGIFGAMGGAMQGGAAGCGKLPEGGGGGCALVPGEGGGS